VSIALALPPIKPILRYPGGKARLAPWIVGLLPPHGVYLEPFFGAGSVFFAKPPAKVEIVNDLDGRVINLFRVLRSDPDELVRLVVATPYSRVEYKLSDEPTDDPIEAARRFLIRVNMAHAGKIGSTTGWRQGWAGGDDQVRGSSARYWKGLPDRLLAAVDRLRDAMIDCRSAVEVLADWAVPEALVYADPPYCPGTLVSGDGRAGAQEWARYYRHGMTIEDHVALLDVLDAHPGPVLLSGYRSPLYDERLARWRRVDRGARAYRNAKRTESIWLNPVAAASARQPTLLEV
jgi:DNA adenine methylase